MELNNGSAMDRVPPHSEEAERGVLGSLVVDPERVIDLAIEKGIQPESFYLKPHQTLFSALREMHTSTQAIDLITLTEYLKSKNLIEAVNGLGYLQGLIDGMPTSAHAEHYISIVTQKHTLRKIINQAREALEECYHSDKEAEHVLASTEERIFSIGNDNAEGTQVPWPTLIDNTVRDINYMIDNRRGIIGVPSGYRDMDKKLLGFNAGDMIVLAARPSMGKTSLALNIAEHVAMGKGHPEKKKGAVAVFSLEMPAEQLVRRMLCSRAKVSYSSLSGGFLSAERHRGLIDAATELRELPLYIDDAAGLDIMDIRARARRMKRKYDIQFMVVDYLQLLSAEKFLRDGRQRETAAISNGIKNMAKELKIPVLVLSQLSRAPETRDRTAVPKLSDLRDSGSIEQDADVVILLRRPCKYPDDVEASDDTLAIVDIAKNRNGATGELRMNFHEEYTRFEDRMARPEVEPYQAQV